MHRPRAKLLLSAALSAALSVAPCAAAQERRWRVGGSLGFAQLFGGPSAPGFGGGLHAAYGLNDMFDLLTALDVSAHPYARWVIVSGGVGAVYTMDVGRWVPYAGALAGGAGLVSVNPTCGASIAEPCRAFRLSGAIPFGIDHHLTKHLLLGAGGRLQILLLGDVPWLTLAVTAKAEYVWGK